METIGVVGCGAMGAGIVQVALQAGYTVVAREVNDAFLKKGIERVNSAFEKMTAKGTITSEQKEDSLKRLKGVTALEGLSECDFISHPHLRDVEEEHLPGACNPLRRWGAGICNGRGETVACGIEA